MKPDPCPHALVVWTEQRRPGGRTPVYRRDVVQCEGHTVKDGGQAITVALSVNGGRQIHRAGKRSWT